MVSMPYQSAFFALMTQKSVTCAMFPNKPGVPLTEKINYICTFFWRRYLLLHEYFTCFVCVVCFPRPSFKFHSEIFIRRTISEFIPPTKSPSPQYPPPLRLPLPTSQKTAAATTASTTSMFCSDPVM